MVTRRRSFPRGLGRVRLGIASALVASAFACNALLGNEPRELAPSHSAGGGSGKSSSGKAGGAAPGGRENAMAGEAGATARPAGGRPGESGAGGEGGIAQGTAGESAGHGGAAGEAGNAGEAGTGGRAPDPCELTTAECSNGDVEDAGSLPCGHCGSQPLIRRCGDTCTWGEPVASGACAGEGCAPNDTGTQTVNCPCGGTKNQTRTCTDGCTWGAWTDTTSCDVGCCTSVVYCNTQESSVASEYPGRGTWCRQDTTACSDTEAYADCLASADFKCGAVTPSLFMEYH